MSYESGKTNTVKRREPYQEVFEENEKLISKMRLDMIKIAKDPLRNNIGIFLDCAQPFSQASPLDLILNNYALPRLFRNGS